MNRLPSLCRSYLMVLCQTELIAQLWNTVLYHTNLYQTQSQIIHHNHNFLYTASCPNLRCRRRIIDLTPQIAYKICANNHRRFIYIFALANDTTVIQLGIIQTRRQILPCRNQFRIAKSDLCSHLLIILLKCLIGAKCHRAKHSALHGVIIHYNSVFLIVARPAGNGQNAVHSIGHFSLAQVIIIHGTRKGHFSIAENMSGIIEAISPIRRINGQTLFGLRTGQLIARGLIVRGKRNHRCHHTHNRRRVYFHVRCFRSNGNGIIRDK